MFASSFQAYYEPTRRKQQKTNKEKVRGCYQSSTAESKVYAACYPTFPVTRTSISSYKLENMRKENRSTKNYFSTLPTDFTDLKWNNFSRLERLTWLQIHKPFYFKWRFPLPTREFWTSTNIKNSVWNLKKWRSFFFLVFLINCCSFSCVIPSYIFDRSFLYIQFSIYIPHNHIKTYTISW